MRPRRTDEPPSFSSGLSENRVQPAFPDCAGITESQCLIQQRLLDTFKFGLEEVDINNLFEGRLEAEVETISSCAHGLQLSTYCRGNCRECALNSEPYSQESKKIFAIGPLIEFLKKHPIGSGDILLYDASDPLDYPYLLQLLQYFENSDDYTNIRIQTSCPPGSEGLFKELMKINFKKTKIVLSVLDSNRDRLQKNGIFDVARKASRLNFVATTRCVNIRAIPVGRNHVPGKFSRGTVPEDMSIISPEGPFAAEVHLASDLYPTGRRVESVDARRRAYISNAFTDMSFGGGPLGAGAFYWYIPKSAYVDLDSGELVEETALRHLFRYVYSIGENLLNHVDYDELLDSGFDVISEALKEKKFVLPTDPDELKFYREELEKLLKAFEEYADFFRGKTIWESPTFDSEPYKFLLQRIAKLLSEFGPEIMGKDNFKVDVSYLSDIDQQTFGEGSEYLEAIFQKEITVVFRPGDRTDLNYPTYVRVGQDGISYIGVIEKYGNHEQKIPAKMFFRHKVRIVSREAKKISELTSAELRGAYPGMQTIEGLMNYLQKKYTKTEITEDSVVTRCVIEYV